MLSYLFLLAAATSPELPIADFTPEQTQAIQELKTLVAQENNAQENGTEAIATAIITESAPTPITPAVAIAQPIIITNAIEPKMLEYKHWTGKYSPDKFSISVNGTDIEQGKTCSIPANSQTVEIGYTYSFMNGMKSGGRRISYQLNENITQANITFNWKDDWRVVVDNGKAVKEVAS
jgi:hypothetical protein